MDEANKIIIKDQLISDIEALKKQIIALDEKAKPAPTDCSECDLSRSEAFIEIEVMNKILNKSIMRLSKLEYALSQIDSPDFGVCVECEEPIAIERMKISPESIRCVACENKKQAH
jgi:DnaK suppressor protein